MTKISSRLADARRAEEEGRTGTISGERPLFHLTPPVGWMNDPNGFSFFKGEYHLFFQYNPYSVHWDTMHWGHAVSHDLLEWRYLPAALAPDMPYDAGGCFSGCAVGLPDGRQLLMYTGLEPLPDADSLPQGFQNLQAQCIAVGDGTDYVKSKKNPVIGTNMLPAGMERCDFRDPKIILLKDGTYLALTVTRNGDGDGVILMYRSRDGFSWEYWKPLLQNNGRFGTMWECPDFFELDGKWVLLMSPMEMQPGDGRYNNGYGTVALVGDFDEKNGTFVLENDQPLDRGIDFYAAQTVLAEDGRRIMIGWMQNWETITMHRGDLPWAGQMSLPRELYLRGTTLCQRPVRELAAHYGNEVFYRKVPVSGEISLYGVEGRTIDLEICVDAAEGEDLYRWFEIRLAMDRRHHTSVLYCPSESLVRIDRHYAGSGKGVVHESSCRMGSGSPTGKIRIRIILDRFSLEVFLNDGEYVMTALIYTDLAVEQIAFLAGGRAVADVTKRQLCRSASE